jgi:hypothetical protein
MKRYAQIKFCKDARSISKPAATRYMERDGPTRLHASLLSTLAAVSATSAAVSAASASPLLASPSAAPSSTSFLTAA